MSNFLKSMLRAIALESLTVVLLTSVLGCTYSFADSEAEKIQKILSVAKPLPNDRVFYRWQSGAGGKNLLDAGEITDSLYKHFSSERGEQAGPGIYLAGNPHSSASYGRGESPSIIEVHVAKGTPYLDVNDPAVLESLNRLGISKHEVTKLLHSPVLIHYEYESDWWVWKGKEGVTFKKFEGKELSMSELEYAYNELRFDMKQQQAFREAIANTILERYQRNPEIIKYKVTTASLPVAHFMPEIEVNVLKAAQNPKVTDQLLEQFRKRNDLFSALKPEVKTTFINAVVQQAEGQNLSRILNLLRVDTSPPPAYQELLLHLITQPDTFKLKETALTALSQLKPEQMKFFAGEKQIQLTKSLVAQATQTERREIAQLSLESYLKVVYLNPENQKPALSQLYSWLADSNPALQRQTLSSVYNAVKAKTLTELDEASIERIQKLVFSESEEMAREAFLLLAELETAHGTNGNYLNKTLLEKAVKNPNTISTLAELEATHPKLLAGTDFNFAEAAATTPRHKQNSVFNYGLRRIMKGDFSEQQAKRWIDFATHSLLKEGAHSEWLKAIDLAAVENIDIVRRFNWSLILQTTNEQPTLAARLVMIMLNKPELIAGPENAKLRELLVNQEFYPMAFDDLVNRSSANDLATKEHWLKLFYAKRDQSENAAQALLSMLERLSPEQRKPYHSWLFSNLKSSRPVLRQTSASLLEIPSLQYGASRAFRELAAALESGNYKALNTEAIQNGLSETTMKVVLDRYRMTLSADQAKTFDRALQKLKPLKALQEAQARRPKAQLASANCKNSFFDSVLIPLSIGVPVASLVGVGGYFYVTEPSRYHQIVPRAHPQISSGDFEAECRDANGIDTRDGKCFCQLDQELKRFEYFDPMNQDCIGSDKPFAKP